MGYELHGEFKKISPPSFDGETGEGAEAWLLNMSKYFLKCIIILVAWNPNWPYINYMVKQPYGGKKQKQFIESGEKN